jgi:hypothetical protein
MGKTMALVLAGLVSLGSVRGAEILPGGCFPAQDIEGKLYKVDVYTPLPRVLQRTWRLDAGGKDYVLDLGTGPALVKQAEHLQGRRVIVTGWVRGTTIAVVGLKEAPPKQTVSVEIKGKLRCVVTHWYTGEVLFVTDTMPTSVSRSWALYTGVTIDGRTYLLDHGGNKALARQLAPRAELLGQWAEVRGPLQGDRVLVSSFNVIEAK